MPGSGEGAPRAVLAVPVPALEPTGALVVADVVPRDWSDDDVERLADLAAAVAAELELQALRGTLERTRARSELAFAAAGIGSFQVDLVAGTMVWDERMEELFGFAPGEFDQRTYSFLPRVHPDDAERVRDVMRRAVATCGEAEVEFRACPPRGGVRWVHARGRVLAGPDGRAARLIGAAYDITAEREIEARVAQVLESMPTAFYLIDRDARFRYVNAKAERLFGRPRAELLGRVAWEVFPEALGTEFERRFHEAVAGSGAPVVFEAFYPPPLARWYEVHGWPGPDGVAVYFHDITERREHEAALERAAARSALLARVSAELSGTLDAR
ncbi:MAG TPA: PAS domain-containing protein, partial [Anaeromyxobacteraceae bacterium]|nr:PAS domain-containing protein [Anaeromyxobacteraceae bacterium]